MSDGTDELTLLLDELLAEADNGQNMTRAAMLAERISDLYDTLRAQLSEAQARLTEIERQRPVMVVENTATTYRGAPIVLGLEHGTKLYAAPVSPAAQATDARMAAVEQAAALAEKVSGPDTARTIRHNGVVMRGDCECTMCKRYNHVEG